MWRGKMYGFPYNCSAEVPLMNAALFEEAGLDPKEQIETWDEWTEVSKQLVKFDDAGTLQVAAYVNWFPRHSAAWFWINGGDAYDAANDQITIDQEANVEGLQTVIDYAWNVYGDIAKADDYLAGTGSESGSPFCVNALAIDYAGDWMPSTYNAWCPGVKMWPQLFPKGPQGTDLVAIGAGDFIAILRGAPNPDEAYKFAEWQVMKGNLMWTEAGVDTDCVKKNAGVVREDWIGIFGDEDTAAEVSKMWAEWGDKSRAVENFPAYNFANSEMRRVFDLAFHKQMTAAEALAEVQMTVDEEMDKFRIPE
jgi:multiple sugar transport system substrate-binding protein